MYYAFAVIAAVVALGLIVLYVLRHQTGFVQHREEIDRELRSEAVPTLEYEVPLGQDPATILAALEQAGYLATTDPSTHPLQTMLIACPQGLDHDRARVRSVIESVGVTTPDDGAPIERRVRFVDE